MNERTKQLAEQAGFKILTDGRIIPTLDHNGECGRDLEKFAELILGECLDILDGEDDHGYTAKRVRIAAYRIKERFGVEE